MASVEGKFVRGVVGPTIFRKVGNRQFVSSKSKQAYIKMTEATYQASYIFGRASTIASYIRMGADQLLAFYDSRMISRLTGQCNHIIQKATIDEANTLHFDQDYFGRLNGFEFNESSPVKQCLFAQPELTLTEQDVFIDFPEMSIHRDLVFTQTARYCTVALRVLLIDLKNYRYQKQEIQSFEVESNMESYTFPAQRFHFKGAPGTLCVAYLGLFYAEKTFAGKAVMNHVGFSPAAILKAAFCPGDVQENAEWLSMRFNEKKQHKHLKKKK